MPDCRPRRNSLLARLWGLGLPVDVERASPGTLVVEVIMQPEYTPLLNAARSRNLQVLTGKAMLEGQISELFAFLTEGQNSFGNAE